MTGRKSKQVAEFGDFQKSESLAALVCDVLRRIGVAPRCILEPTCGRGSFVSAAAAAFPTAHLIGVDLNPRHLAVARERLQSNEETARIELLEGDFPQVDWETVLASCSNPWLILGNPPWVTSAELGTLASGNLPKKSNFHGRSGMDALTGKSNFDISKWMLLRCLDWLRERGGWVAVLVKTAVARKLLAHAWRVRYPVKSAAIYSINALEHFGAAFGAALGTSCVTGSVIVPGSVTTARKSSGTLARTRPVPPD